MTAWRCAEVCHDALVDLSRKEAFQASDDLAFGPAIGGASGDVVAGWLVESHADDDGSIEGGVGVSVTAPIEPMPAGGSPGRGRDRTGATQLRERGFGANPVGVIAEEDQHLGRGACADPEALTKRGRRLGREAHEVPVVRRDFLVEGDPAAGECPEGVLGGGGCVEGPGLRPAQRVRRAWAVRPWSVSRSPGDAVTMICFKVIIAAVRAFTAVSRATLSWRMISTAPSAVLGIAVDWPASTDRAAASASIVSDLPAARRKRRSPRFTSRDTMPRSADGPRQAGTIAAGAFDAERLNPPVCVGPHEQGLISARISDERVIAQADPPGVDRHRDVDILVGIDPDNHLPNLGLRGHGVSHRLASSGAARGLARVGGQDCDGPWVRQAPMGSRPIRSAGCRTSGRWAVTDRSMTRTVGQSSCGSGHRPPAPTGVTERPRQAGGSCSQST